MISTLRDRSRIGSARAAPDHNRRQDTGRRICRRKRTRGPAPGIPWLPEFAEDPANALFEIKVVSLSRAQNGNAYAKLRPAKAREDTTDLLRLSRHSSRRSQSTKRRSASRDPPESSNEKSEKTEPAIMDTAPGFYRKWCAYRTHICLCSPQKSFVFAPLSNPWPLCGPLKIRSLFWLRTRAVWDTLHWF